MTPTAATNSMSSSCSLAAAPRHPAKDAPFFFESSLMSLSPTSLVCWRAQIFISIIQPYFLAGMFPLMVLYFFVQKFYRASYIEMQRIDATTRSPIYAHFSETLTGVETLRAYGFQERFAMSNEAKIDYNHRSARLPGAMWTFLGSCGAVVVWRALSAGAQPAIAPHHALGVCINRALNSGCSGPAFAAPQRRFCQAAPALEICISKSISQVQRVSLPKCQRLCCAGHTSRCAWRTSG